MEGGSSCRVGIRKVLNSIGFRAYCTNNGLLLACLTLFFVFFLGMIVSGTATYNQEQLAHGSTEQISVLGYLTTGAFVEATFENWESEFLQMGMYVVLTALLYQKGSSESKPLRKHAPQDDDPRDATPSPTRPGRSGKAVGCSASTSTRWRSRSSPCSLHPFALHALGGARAYNEEQIQHGEAAVSTWRYVTTSQFWFESMQNWQSEFIAVAAIVGLSIFLRQRGSPESKPVADPHYETSA